jgi:MFS superfamily sulfate permease-like transporter
MSWREGLLSLATTLGVLVLGVLPGVVLSIALSLLWLLVVALRPGDAVLGEVPGLKGFHSTTDYPQAVTVPGLLLYRFNANLVFFNVDYFCERLRAAVRRTATPVAWVVVDLSPVNVVDATAMQRFDELRAEMAARGITLGVARVKRQLGRPFDPRWVERRLAAEAHVFPSLRSAVRAFHAAHAEAGTTG